MEDFLKDRGVEGAIIEKMKEEGIDEAVVSTMTVDQLNKYIPRYGDCLAAIAFSKKQLTSSGICESETSKGRRMSLRDRLMAKLQGKKGLDEHTRRSVPQEGNRNAKKHTKKIELGWLHSYGSCNILKQVRSPSGGGTRTIDIDVNSTVSELLNTAIALFFPNGKSKKGNENDFNFYIANQTQEKQEGSLTIKQIYESTKLKILRFYLVSSAVVTTSADICGHELLQKGEEGSLKCIPDTDPDRETKGNNLSNAFEELPDICDTETTLYVMESDLQSLHSFTMNATQNDMLTSPNASNETLFDTDFLIDSPVSTIPAQEQPLISTKVDIKIHRTIVQDELIMFFKDPNVINQNLTFSFVNEKGQDADGVSRDAYSEFWTSFLLRNTDGETYRVPVLTNDYSHEEWEAIGRILLKGFKDHRYLPIGLAPAFLIAIVHGEDVVTPQQLKNSFLHYLSSSEKDIIESACNGSSYDEDELISVLDRFQCHRIPNQEEMSSAIIQIAHRVLIQEPKYALDAMKGVCGNALQLFLPDIESVSALYERLNPSVAKVIRLLKATPSTKEENASFGFLQRFIRGRNKEQLKLLLRLLTGSDVVCVDKIDITFVVRYGKGRIPTIHTCGPSLELPSTYINFPDFRSEWESILSDKDSMKMSIA
ncbi:uncharacterized protein LOC117336293 [Pecten maximus]|uniref:uncharacterized protein LOC117336293 n=1 Tax=Pecten maximus TaxID=6579 RepID=UPI001458CA75|nr:uncharacterized protein LOC117336293 [Pecten maximus]